MFHVPASGAAVLLAPATVDGVVTSESESSAGASPSMKWMYTNGPPTTSTSATTTPPMTQRNHERFFGVGDAMGGARFGRGRENGRFGLRRSLGGATVRFLRTGDRGPESDKRAACRSSSSAWI